MNGKETVIVTGSSGLIGSAVVCDLAGSYQIVGFDLEGEPYPPPQAECVSVDLTDSESIDRGLSRVKYAYGEEIASVIHLAAYYDFSGEESELYDEVTVRGTGRLLNALQRFTVRQFIFSSTMLAHRPTKPGRPITEDDPLEGKWPYPKSKIRTEKLIREKRGDIPALILRIAGVYTDKCDSLPLSQQIARIYENRLTSHVYPGDVTHGQAFVHLDDLVRAFRAAVEKRKSLPEEAAILIGEPETHSYGDLQKALGRLLHDEKDWKTEEIPKTLAKTGAWIQDQIPGIEEPFIKPWMVDLADDHYELDTSRARENLEWEPKHRLIDRLPKMVAALKDDPAKWYEHHNIEPPEKIEDDEAEEAKTEKAASS